MKDQRPIFTIGHSNHPIDRFIDLLKQHSVRVLCDVRSSPYSRFNPQFNYDRLKTELPRHDISYVFLGRELGARTNDPSCYADGRVDYDKLAETPPFRKGIERVEKEAELSTVALMCAEKDPIACHRTILVAPRLIEHGLRVRHILEDGRIEEHDEAMRRLRHELDIADDDLFLSEAELTEQACRLQGERIAFRPLEADDWQPEAVNEDAP